MLVSHEQIQQEEEMEFSEGLHHKEQTTFINKKYMSLIGVCFSVLLSFVLICLMIKSKTVANQEQSKIVTEKAIEEVTIQMMHRPYSKILEPDQEPRQYKRATPMAYFAYRHMLQPELPEYNEAELHRYQTKYEIDSRSTLNELSLCIISTGYNVGSKEKRIEAYFDAIFRQNYSNYHVVWIDDASTDGSFELAKEYLNEKKAKFLDKVTFIRNEKRKGSFYNKNLAVHNHCLPGEIIVDIDSDDVLIGKQVFGLIQIHYEKNPHLWLIYTAHIIYLPEFQEPLIGSSQELSASLLNSKKQRLLGNFTILALRTFRREVYMKIPSVYMKDKDGNFRVWISDGWIYSAIAEFSGPKRILFLDEPTYFYFRESDKLNHEVKKKSTMEMRFSTPFKELASINEEPATIENYKIIEEEREKVEKKYNRAYAEVKEASFTPNEQIQNYVKQLESVPITINDQFGSNFAYHLLNAPLSKEHSKAQEYHFNEKYSMHEWKEEMPICIIGKLNNADFGEVPVRFIESIHRQLYETFQLIFHLPDNLEKTSAKIFSYIKSETPRLISRTNFTKEENNCKDSSIIIVMDIGSELIGRHILKLISSLFQKAEEMEGLIFEEFPMRDKNGEENKAFDKISDEKLRKIVLDNISMAVYRSGKNFDGKIPSESTGRILKNVKPIFLCDETVSTKPILR